MRGGGEGGRKGRGDAWEVWGSVECELNGRGRGIKKRLKLHFFDHVTIARCLIGFILNAIDLINC